MFGSPPPKSLRKARAVWMEDKRLMGQPTMHLGSPWEAEVIYWIKSPPAVLLGLAGVTLSLQWSAKGFAGRDRQVGYSQRRIWEVSLSPFLPKLLLKTGIPWKNRHSELGFQIAEEDRHLRVRETFRFIPSYGLIYPPEQCLSNYSAKISGSWNQISGSWLD